MKKIMMSLTVLALTVGAANAQKGGGFKLGVNAGVLSGNGTYDDGSGSATATSSKIGFKIGFNTDFKLASGISFMPELNYTSKGIKTAQVGTGYSYTMDATTNFLEIPLNFSYSFGEASKGFYAGLGPVISLGLGGSYSSTDIYLGNSKSGSGSVKFDGKKQADLAAGDKDVHLKALEFGGNLFVGYKINQDLNVKVMYNIGFSNLTPEDKGSYKTNYVGLTFGYSLMK